MSIYKRAKEFLFEKDLMALIKTPEDKSSSEAKKENTFKGAWEKEGKAEWGYFIKAEDTEEEKEQVSKTDKKNEKDKPDGTDKDTPEKPSPPKDTKIKVFFAEDNRSVHLAIKTFIKGYKEMKLLGSAVNGKEAVEKIKSMDEMPDVILMDIAMPRMSGIDSTKEILAFNPSIKIIMLTAYGTKQYVVDAFSAGAIGFLRKDGGLGIIREAITQAATGGVVPLQDEIAAHLVDGADDDELILLDDDAETEGEIEEVVEEIEMTEDEFIDELLSELLEQLLSVETDDHDNYLKELLEKK